MATVPEYSVFAESLHEALETVSLENGIRRAGFDVARILKGAYSDATEAIESCYEALETLADSGGFDMDELAEIIYFSWPKVLSASDSDPVHEALQFAKTQKPLTLLGSWPPSRKFKNDAATVFLMCRYLSQDGSRAFYLPCRKLAAALGCNHFRAAEILKALVQNGFLRIVKGNTRNRAAYYEITATQKN